MGEIGRCAEEKSNSKKIDALKPTNAPFFAENVWSVKNRGADAAYVLKKKGERK